MYIQKRLHSIQIFGLWKLICVGTYFVLVSFSIQIGIYSFNLIYIIHLYDSLHITYAGTFAFLQKRKLLCETNFHGKLVWNFAFKKIPNLANLWQFLSLRLAIFWHRNSYCFQTWVLLQWKCNNYNFKKLNFAISTYIRKFCHYFFFYDWCFLILQFRIFCFFRRNSNIGFHILQKSKYVEKRHVYLGITELFHVENSKFPPMHGYFTTRPIFLLYKE